MPPEPLIIFDESGARRTTFVGPYREKEDITLICDAFGGFNLQNHLMNKFCQFNDIY